MRPIVTSIGGSSRVAARGVGRGVAVAWRRMALRGGRAGAGTGRGGAAAGAAGAAVDLGCAGVATRAAATTRFGVTGAAGAGSDPRRARTVASGSGARPGRVRAMAGRAGRSGGDAGARRAAGCTNAFGEGTGSARSGGGDITMRIVESTRGTSRGGALCVAVAEGTRSRGLGGVRAGAAFGACRGVVGRRLAAGSARTGAWSLRETPVSAAAGAGSAGPARAPSNSAGWRRRRVGSMGATRSTSRSR